MREIAQTISWIVVLAAVTILFAVSGYGARAGLQALAMLALSTLLMALKLEGLPRALGFGAGTVIAGGALVIAFVLPLGAPSAYPLALAVGGGSWLLVALALLLKDRRDLTPYTWAVGALTWIAISLTYASPSLLARAGDLAPYLWIPWATLGFVVGQVAVPWWIAHVAPVLRRALGAWSLSTGRGVAIGLAVTFLAGTSLTFLAANAPALVVDPAAELPCNACAPAEHLLSYRVAEATEGTLAIATFAAPPTSVRLHAAGGNATIDLTSQPEGWLVDVAGAPPIAASDLAIAIDGSTVHVLLIRPDLRGPLAIEAPGGNRAPTEGFASSA